MTTRTFDLAKHHQWDPAMRADRREPPKRLVLVDVDLWWRNERTDGKLLAQALEGHVYHDQDFAVAMIGLPDDGNQAGAAAFRIPLYLPFVPGGIDAPVVCDPLYGRIRTTEDTVQLVRLRREDGSASLQVVGSTTIQELRTSLRDVVVLTDDEGPRGRELVRMAADAAIREFHVDPDIEFEASLGIEASLHRSMLPKSRARTGTDAPVGRRVHYSWIVDMVAFGFPVMRSVLNAHREQTIEAVSEFKIRQRSSFSALVGAYGQHTPSRETWLMVEPIFLQTILALAALPETEGGVDLADTGVVREVGGKVEWIGTGAFPAYVPKGLDARTFARICHAHGWLRRDDETRRWELLPAGRALAEAIPEELRSTDLVGFVGSGGLEEMREEMDAWLLRGFDALRIVAERARRERLDQIPLPFDEEPFAPCDENEAEGDRS